MSEAKAADGLKEAPVADYHCTVGQVARRAGNLVSHGYH
jgi:hypothetical protein